MQARCALSLCAGGVMSFESCLSSGDNALVGRLGGGRKHVREHLRGRIVQHMQKQSRGLYSYIFSLCGEGGRIGEGAGITRAT